MANNFFIKDKIKYHFKENSVLYLIAGITIIIGLIIGIYIAVTGYKYTSLLTSADKTMFDYITGTASYSDIFYTRLTNILLCFLILFVLNLTIYTSFLSYIFIGYQMTLLVLSCGAIINLYGLSGVFNVLLFILPINIANIIVMIVANVLSVRRAKDFKSYRLRFFESFGEDNFIIAFLLCVLASVAICVINSFVFPVFIKSFIVLNY